jgi:hypothetical protein
VAEWSCSGLQSRVQRFDSAPSLHSPLRPIPKPSAFTPQTRLFARSEASKRLERSWLNPLCSVPFLKDELERRGRLGGSLGQYVSARLGRFSTDDNGFLDAAAVDEQSAELLKMAADESEQKAVEWYRHSELFYRYRNSLVHESREPGYGMAVTDSADAHYTAYIGDPRWYLAYPLPMFEALLRRSLASFRQWLTVNGIDPYALIEKTDRF